MHHSSRFQILPLRSLGQHYKTLPNVAEIPKGMCKQQWPQLFKKLNTKILPQSHDSLLPSADCLSPRRVSSNHNQSAPGNERAFLKFFKDSLQLLKFQFHNFLTNSIVKYLQNLSKQMTISHRTVHVTIESKSKNQTLQMFNKYLIK